MHDVPKILISQQSMRPDDLLRLSFTIDRDLSKHQQQEVQQLDLILDDEGVVSPEGPYELVSPGASLQLSHLSLLIIEVLQSPCQVVTLDEPEEFEVLLEHAQLEVKHGSLCHLDALEVTPIVE
jgi:hypothetical protein